MENIKTVSLSNLIVNTIDYKKEYDIRGAAEYLRDWCNKNQIPYEEDLDQYKRIEAWYFRNAMVRANYNDLKNGVHDNYLKNS